MVTAAIALGCVALFPLAGLAIGLGGDRFWWLVERVILAMIALFMGALQKEQVELEAHTAQGEHPADRVEGEL